MGLLRLQNWQVARNAIKCFGQQPTYLAWPAEHMAGQLGDAHKAVCRR